MEATALAAWVALLSRYSREDGHLVACSVASAEPSSGGMETPLRKVPEQGWPEYIGSDLCLPMRLPYSESWTLGRLYAAVRAKMCAARQRSGTLPQGIDLSGQAGFEWRLAAGEVAPGLKRLPLVLCCEWSEPRRLALTLHYACATLDAAAARRLLGHLQQLLIACQRDREQLAAGVGLAAAAERETLQGWSDATATEWDGCLDSVVHTAMLSQAEHCPTRAALVEDQRSMTYLQLAQAAAAVAATLARAGVRGGAAGLNGGLVPLLAARGLEMITGIYGILLAGAAYVPLDVKWPADRIAEVVSQCAPLAGAASSGVLASCLSDAGCPRIVSLCHFCAGLAGDGGDGGDGGSGAVSEMLQTLPVATASPASGAAPVYCFFTSGSTGKPKGVVVPHAGLVHRVRWFQARYCMAAGEPHLLKHSYTFGLSEWEIFWTLSFGGTLVLLKPEGEKVHEKSAARGMASQFVTHHSHAV